MLFFPCAILFFIKRSPITICDYSIWIALSGHALEVILVKTNVLFLWFLSDIPPKWLFHCMITAEILARSFANFHYQYADRQNNLYFIISSRTDAWKNCVNLLRWNLCPCLHFRAGKKLKSTCPVDQWFSFFTCPHLNIACQCGSQYGNQRTKVNKVCLYS